MRRSSPGLAGAMTFSDREIAPHDRPASSVNWSETFEGARVSRVVRQMNVEEVVGLSPYRVSRSHPQRVARSRRDLVVDTGAADRIRAASAKFHLAALRGIAHVEREIDRILHDLRGRRD